MRILERRWFLLLLANAFLLQIVIMFLRISMIYEAVALGMDAFLIGLIGGAFGVFPAMLALHTGRVIDRLGERFTLTVSAALALVSAVAFLVVTPSLGSLLILSSLTGFALFVGVASLHSATGKTASTLEAGRFGAMTMIISLAHMVGPVCFGLLATNAAVPDTTPVFQAAIVVAALLLGVTLLLRIPMVSNDLKPIGLLQTARTILKTRGYLPATIASLVLFSAMDLLVIYMPLFGAENGLDSTTIGILLSIRGGASVVCRLFYGRLIAALGRDRLLIMALFISGITISLIPYMPTVLAIGLLIFIAGFALGIGAPLTLGWIAEVIPPATLGSALALRLAINRSGQAVLPALVGLLASGLGSGAVVMTIGASLLCSGGLSVMFTRRR